MAHLGEDGYLGDVTDEQVDNAGRGRSGMLPAGWYRAALIEDEAKPYDWGLGLNMQFQVLNGDFENRRIFDFLCVRHSKSSEAEEIARAKLKAFGIAVGAKDPNNMRDTDPFYGKPVMLEVIRTKPKDSKYAEEDGKQARVGRVVSVARWKEAHVGEPTPGIDKKPEPPRVETPPPPDDDIPF